MTNNECFTQLSMVGPANHLAMVKKPCLAVAGEGGGRTRVLFSRAQSNPVQLVRHFFASANFSGWATKLRVVEFPVRSRAAAELNSF
jgi:hypothetical protein